MKVHVSVANPVGGDRPCRAQMGEHEEIVLEPGQSHVFVVEHDDELNIRAGDPIVDERAAEADEEGEQA